MTQRAAAKAMKRQTVGGREVLLEFHRIGDYIRVSALDPVSLTEVVIIGSPKVMKHDLIRLATRKLDFVLAKKSPKRPKTRKRYLEV